MRVLALCALLAALIPSSSFGALLDSTTMTLNASGSINTISGFGGFGDLLDLGPGHELEYFTIELVSFESNPVIGLPQGIAFHIGHSSQSSDFTGFSMTQQYPQIGETFTVSENGVSPTPDHIHVWSHGPFDTLHRIVRDHELNLQLGVPTFYGSNGLGIWRTQCHRAGNV